MQSDLCVAVHALVYLSHTGRPQTSTVLAENICTTAPRVRKVLSPLAAAGMIASKEGADGGYYLLKKADSITLRDIAEAVHIHCVSLSWESGDIDRDCIISSGMGPEMQAITKELDEQCMRTLAGKTIKTIETDLEKRGYDHETV